MSKIVKIAVDSMGGDGSPKKIIDGIFHHYTSNKNTFYKIFGNENEISKIIPKNLNNNSYEIIHTIEKVEDTDTPLVAAKKGKKTSMWLAIESVKEKETDIVISAGNTGALLILSKMILEMIEGIDKPALAGLWPNKKGMNIVLDLGANIECSDKNLIDFTYMGSSLYKSLFPKLMPKIAILNVGSEENKGHDEIKKAYKFLKENKINDFEFIGYVEGNHITEGKANVIVTDGFTGNIALKTAEGTANFVTNILKESLNRTFYSRVIMFLNYLNFKKFKDKLDPRKYNGAIFLGLKGPIVKSHGSTDSFGFANSIKMCKKIVEGNLIEKIKRNLN